MKELKTEVLAWLAHQEVRVYLVGGSVRDVLLGRTSYDLDLAIDGDGLDLARRLANGFGGAFYPLDEGRGTGRAILTSEGAHPLIVDVAGLRGPDLAADLRDRDFTINALAADVRRPDEIIDRHGGLVDLQAGVIRAVSETSIKNDPIRAMRAVRQSAELGFTLAPETVALIRRDQKGLGRVSGERIRDELARILARPDGGLHLHQLEDLGLLTIVLPELEGLRGMVQSPPHCLDGLAHSLQAVVSLDALLASLSGDHGDSLQPDSIGVGESPPVAGPLAPFANRLMEHLTVPTGGGRPRLVAVKIAALLHDTGKPSAQAVGLDGRWTFIGHEKQSTERVEGALRRLRFNNGEIRLADAIVRNHMRPLQLASQEVVSARAVYRFFRDTQGAGVDTLLHAMADHRATYAPGTGMASWERLEALVARMLADYWDRTPERVDPPPLVRGHDLVHGLGLPPGPIIGRLLESVREAQVAGEVATRVEALALVQELLETEA